MTHRNLKMSSFFSIFLFFMFLLTSFNMSAADGQKLKNSAASDISLKNEIQHSIDKGLQWLKNNQNSQGFWSQAEYPALSGLVLTAFMGEPSGHYLAQKPDFIVKGYDYLQQCAKPDGSISVKGLANYNTAVSMVALQVAHDPAYEQILRRARNYLVGLQQDVDKRGEADNLFDGGIGYGDRYKHSDMSNTTFALEALYYTKYMEQDTDKSNMEMKKLNWPAAIEFIQRCQNLPGYNDQAWASDDPQNKGGFVYFPGDSKADEMKLPSGKTALRSYGSISYAGLLSYIYADLDEKDPRVKAVFEWLCRNYTLDENPGMGPEGLFYYYHTMAKALAAHGADVLVTADGKKVSWRKDLALRFLNLQHNDGFWVNENGRWWEKDPVLVTSYALISLEIIYRGL